MHQVDMSTIPDNVVPGLVLISVLAVAWGLGGLVALVSAPWSETGGVRNLPQTPAEGDFPW